MAPKKMNNLCLWLVWKDTNSRERFVVGLLSFDEQGYGFRYIENEGKNNLREALQQGFKLLPAFPSREQEYYQQQLFHVFLNRLPSRKRNDTQSFLKQKGLSLECSDYELLKETGGKLPTDALEFVEPFTFESGDTFEIEFFIAGLRYYEIGNVLKEELLPNTKLLLKLEPDNPFDSHAIEIFTLGGKKLGHVPVFYSRYIDLAVKTGDITSVIISFNAESDYDEKLRIQVSGNSDLAHIIENLGKMP